MDAESRLIAYKNPQLIESSVRTALSQMAEINRVGGVFSPPGSDQRADQEQLAAADRGELRSIIFPLLGTGKGGARPADVIGPMVDGLTGFLSDPDNQALAQTLRDIYILAYTRDELAAVAAELAPRLTSITGTEYRPDKL